MERDLENFFAEHDLAETSERTYRHYLVEFFEWLHSNGLSLEAADASTGKRWITGHEAWSSSTRYNASNAISAYARWKLGPGHSLSRLRVKRESPGPQRTLGLQLGE